MCTVCDELGTEEKKMKEGVNQFARLGISDEKVRDRVKECFRTIFEDPEERFFHEVDADSACMVCSAKTSAIIPTPTGWS